MMSAILISYILLALPACTLGQWWGQPANLISSSPPQSTTSAPTQADVLSTETLLPSERKQFKSTIIDEINKYRLMHSSAPITVDGDLSKNAASWAHKMARDGHESINPDSPYGQLTFSSPSPVPNAAVAATRHWYNRIKNYAWDHPKVTSKAMQFTQLIWAGSQQVGVGEAMSPNGVTYVVVLFNPLGNKQNDVIQNVQPVTGSANEKKGPDACPRGWHKFKKNCYRTTLRNHRVTRHQSIRNR